MRELGTQPFWYGIDNDRFINSIRLLKKAGFNYTFLPFNPFKPELCEEYLKVCDEVGITVQSLHAPFGDINRMWYDEPVGDSMLQMLLDTVEFCGKHNIEICVIHESGNRIGPDVSYAGIARFRKIFELGQKLGVKVAVENVRRTNNIGKIFADITDLPTYFCWDSGHEICYTPGVDHVAFWGEKLICTHIHDNHGRYMGDEHLLPFDGNMDWERKAKFIKLSGYKGPLMGEIKRNATQYLDLTDEQFAEEAYKRMRKFADMCE